MTPLAPFGWQNVPSTATPLSAQELELFAQYLAAYAESLGGGGTGTPPIPSGGTNRSALVTDSSATTTGGVRWSVKAAPYNICENTGSTPGASPTASPAANTAAFNAKLAEASGKGPVLIPPGIYNMNSGNLIPSNTELYGHGRKSVLKVDTSVILPVEVFHNSDMANGNSNITLRDFEIDGNRAARGGDQITATGHGQLVFRGYTSTGGSTGTGGPLCKNIKVLNMYMHDAAGIGMGFVGVEDGLVQGCTIYGNGRDGCGTYGPASNCRWIGNHIYNVGDDGIGLSNGLQGSDQNHDLIVANNHIHDGASSGNGINMTGCRNGTIVGNTIRRPQNSGISLAPFENFALDGVTVAGNTILDPGLGMTPVGDKAWGLEIRVRYWSGDGSGAFDGGPSAISNVVVDGNTILAPMSHGILFAGVSAQLMSWCKVVNNTFVGGFGSNYYTSAHGIHLSSFCSFIHIAGNTFRDWRGRAINGGSQPHSYINIVDNEIYSCCRANTGFSVIDLTNTTSCRVVSNRVADFVGTHGPVVARGGTAGLRIRDNDFTAGGTSNVSGTVGSGYLEMDNVGVNGTRYAGTAATVGNMP